MRALLHNLLLDLQSSDAQILDGWQQILDLEIEAAAARPDLVIPQIHLAAAVVGYLQPPPETKPSYEEPKESRKKRLMRYYETENGGFLDLARPAQIVFNFEKSTTQIKLTRPVLDAGNLEDLTLIALAPFLRRRGIFITHAFAAVRPLAEAPDAAVLICGPPGSGKTSTGLALLDQGFGFLANDAALLGEAQGQVKVYPSPGTINLHPETITLLPAYRNLGDGDAHPMHIHRGKIFITRGTLLEKHARAAPAAVQTILFPSLTDGRQHTLHEVLPAVGLARLIEENIDQWDENTFLDHINLLTNLSRQATFYDLYLARGQTFTM